MSSAHLKVKRHIPFVWISKTLYRALNPSWRAILAYNALAYYANSQSGTCEKIPLRTMARLVGVSEDTLMRGLAELERKKAVIVHKRSTKSTAGKRVPLPNLYELADLDSIPGEPI